MTDVPEITVLFFAGARDAAGTARVSRPWAGLTVDEARRRLEEENGGQLGRLLDYCALWVNGSPAAAEALLAEGDELAVLPPVSGGCAAVTSVSGSLRPC